MRRLEVGLVYLEGADLLAVLTFKRRLDDRRGWEIFRGFA